MNTNSDLWLDDANLILTVGDKRFKIYKGLLARASPVFRDLFEIPQPGGENGSWELELGDEGTELVMRTLHGFPCFSVQRPLPLSQIVSIADFALKFEMSEILLDVYSFLSVLFPLSLDGWDRAQSAQTESLKTYISDVNSLAALAALIDLAARRPDSALRCFVPTAYLRICLNHPPYDILNSGIPSHVANRAITGRNSILGKGIRPLEDAVNPYRTCHTREHCAQILSNYFADRSLQAIERKLTWPMLTRGRLEEDMHRFNRSNGGAACDMHMNQAIGRLIENRHKIWKSLPEAFGTSDSWSKTISTLYRASKITTPDIPHFHVIDRVGWLPRSWWFGIGGWVCCITLVFALILFRKDW